MSSLSNLSFRINNIEEIGISATEITIPTNNLKLLSSASLIDISGNILLKHRGANFYLVNDYSTSYIQLTKNPFNYGSKDYYDNSMGQALKLIGFSCSIDNVSTLSVTYNLKIKKWDYVTSLTTETTQLNITLVNNIYGSTQYIPYTGSSYYIYGQDCYTLYLQYLSGANNYTHIIVPVFEIH